jgi:uncharacterized protein (TIGR00730 family)
LDFFFARKWLLINYSGAFIVFPGGFGTLDEFTEVITLIQTKKLAQVPIVLIGKDYWYPFLEWATNEGFGHGLIDKTALELFIITDDIEQAFRLVRDTCSY